MILRASEAEQALAGRRLDAEAISAAAAASRAGLNPQSGVRGAGGYRLRMTEVMVRRGLTALAKGDESRKVPPRPIHFGSSNPATLSESHSHRPGDPIEATVNGKPVITSSGSDLTLRLVAGRSRSGFGMAPHRNQGGLCGGRVRVLSGLLGFRSHVVLPDSRLPGPPDRGRHRGGPGQRQAHAGPGGLLPHRRRPVRLLHSGLSHVVHQALGPDSPSHHRRESHRPGRQLVPVHGLLPDHRGGGPGQRGTGGRGGVKSGESTGGSALSRPTGLSGGVQPGGDVPGHPAGPKSDPGPLQSYSTVTRGAVGRA